MDARVQPSDVHSHKQLNPANTHAQSTVLTHTDFNRGKGVGASLVRQLVAGTQDAVYLTTISRRRAFYERAGFEELPFAAAPR